MSGMDTNVERSKLLNRQKAEKSAAQKEMKKKRGDLLVAAQKKFEEMEARHEQELREFDQSHGLGGNGGDKAKTNEGRKAKYLTINEVRDMSKKELEEACAERGVSKKGSREDIMMRLIVWIQEHDDIAPEEEKPKPVPMTEKKEEKSDEDEDSDDDAGTASSWLVKKDPNAPAEAKKEIKARPARSGGGGGGRGRRGGRGGRRGGGSQREQPQKKAEESSSEDEEEEKQTPEQAAAAEEKLRMKKRRDFLEGAIRKVVQSHSSGLQLDELADAMIEEGLLRDKSKFTPEFFGVKSIEALLIDLSGNGFNYDSATSIIYPPEH